MTTVLSEDLTARCARFVYAEAELLDERRLDEWTNLFAEDALYWLPMNPEQADPGDGLNLVLDDLPRLRDRVSRLTSGLAFSEEPHSRTSHLIGNVRLLPGEQAGRLAGRPVAGGEHVVAARCVVGRSRRGTTETFHARTVWILRPTGDDFVIVVKRVDLLNAADPLPVLTFLL
ncbi:MAG TPA: aromatic-ring-hydroxylating dioxygenase subunit beta [Amycolatopsis sp.]|nr:aromatic-ring-hydroxylating dioxygenase subunit beta [Amycolatopsis sp.]